MRFLDMATDQWWLYMGEPDYALGTSLCYQRSFWMGNPFAAKMVGEDNEFVFANRRHLAAVDAGEMMYATTHPGNTSPRNTNRSSWQRIA